MKWPLPDVVHPIGKLCFQIEIPNEQAYIGAFYGAIFLLSKPYAWADDPAHTALQVGQVWRDIFYAMRPGNCAVTPPILPTGNIEDFAMPLRVDCDCNVFVTCCDGTEKQILTADQVREAIGVQPGSGAIQPPAGGGCQQYSIGLPGNGRWLLPTPVNTGDTIEISGAQGLFYENSSGLWFCPDGSQFILGVCTGITGTSGTNPIPSANTGRLIAQIGSTFYDVIGSTFTVPAGHSNSQVIFQQNTDDLANGSGNVTALVTVCNNQPAQWTHTFDFRVSDGGFVLTPGYGEFLGQWTPGLGWQVKDTAGIINGMYRRVLAISRSFPSTHITNLQCTFTNTQGEDSLSSERSQYCLFNNAYYQWNRNMGAAVSGSNLVDTAPLDNPGTTQMEIGLQTDTDPSNEASFTGDGWITTITVQGLGTDPF